MSWLFGTDKIAELIVNLHQDAQGKSCDMLASLASLSNRMLELNEHLFAVRREIAECRVEIMQLKEEKKFHIKRIPAKKVEPKKPETRKRVRK